MGAWGTEPFANDDAMDWIADLETAKDLRVVRAALDAVPGDGAEYIEAPVGCVALAAAEVVAAPARTRGGGIARARRIYGTA
jgi:hypothetical protein